MLSFSQRFNTSFQRTLSSALILSTMTMGFVPSVNAGVPLGDRVKDNTSRPAQPAAAQVIAPAQQEAPVQRDHQVDRDEVFEYYRKAVNQGQVREMRNIAVMLSLPD